ncbi:MAG TPA: alpha/beta hydrolase [Gemmatimonadaceae bacterium]|nr:alpha/beta hydrolase [Gemmatimonadaceae bacterium]
MSRRFVLLPGLDGTGLLFDNFLRAAPADVQLDVCALPHDPVDYAGLAMHLAPRLDLSPATVLLAESFSGPLAIMLAEAHAVGGLVLCNSFVEPPRSRALRVLARPWLFRRPPPVAFIRRFLVGREAPDALVARVRSVIASVPPTVPAGRLKTALSVSVSARLARCAAPVLYLRGTADRVVSEASVDAVFSAAANQVSVVKLAAPHLLLQVEPEAAWRAIDAATA